MTTLHAQLRRRRAPAQQFALEVDRAAAAPGESVGVRVTGVATPVEVSLMRIERGPSGRLAIACAGQVLDPDSSGVALCTIRVPERLPPTSSGERCAIEFAVRARSPLRGRRSVVIERPLEVGDGGRPVHVESRLSDRMIANFASRHFHLELSEAVLAGGGRLAGRVHIDREVAPGALEIAVHCLECWRTSPPSLWWRQPPTWTSRTLWSDVLRTELDGSRNWHGFVFDLADGLPPAVEGYALAWRYEIEAHRPARLGPGERAMITPLQYEIG
ncbi:MAG TPA: hypothetical protein VKV34_13080 [Thermoleophilia bacterium]|nr:hypothetical protein [Thermoleophilia bacterium]